MKKVVILNDTRHCHAGTVVVMDNLRFLCDAYDMEIINSWSLENLRRFEDEALAQIKGSADMVIINGEGTPHDNTPNMRIFDRLTGYKPTALINTVWQRNQAEHSWLGRLDYIATRESFSKNEIQAKSPNTVVDVVPDLSLYSTGLFQPAEGCVVGFQDSVLQDITRWLSSQPNYMPMRQEGHIPSLPDVLEWMEGLGFLVTGRFHGVCLAMMMKVPFIAIPSNTHKIEGMLADAGLFKLLVQAPLLDLNDKLELAQKRTHLAHKYSIHARRKIKRMFAKLKNL